MKDLRFKWDLRFRWDSDPILQHIMNRPREWHQRPVTMQPGQDTPSMSADMDVPPFWPLFQSRDWTRSFWGTFPHPPTPKTIFWGTKTTNPYRIRSFLVLWIPPWTEISKITFVSNSLTSFLVEESLCNFAQGMVTIQSYSMQFSPPCNDSSKKLEVRNSV